MGRIKLVRSPMQTPINSPKFLRTFVFDRAPTEKDFRMFVITDMWIHRNPGGSPAYGFHILADKPVGSAVWLNIGGKQEGDIQTILGDGGSPVTPDAEGNVDIIGGLGVTTSGSGSSLTINASLPSLHWLEDTTTPINVSISEAHISNAPSQIVYNLPAVAGIGDGFAFFDLGGNGFSITANTGQTIRVGNQVTTAAGTVTSTAIGDIIWIVCGIADTEFLGYSVQGNLTLA